MKHLHSTCPYNTQNSFQIKNQDLFITEEKCPSEVLPNSTGGRDKISKEPFSTSTLKLPISQQISPEQTQVNSQVGTFLIIFPYSKWILVASLDSCWQELRYLPSVPIHIGRGKQFALFPKQWAWEGKQ